jgi:hypothetical protein
MCDLRCTTNAGQLRSAPPVGRKQHGIAASVAALLLPVVLGAACNVALADDDTSQNPATRELPNARAMAAARKDVWGAASLSAPSGPSYEFFRALLPPLCYVNTEFRHYPIVLSAPAAAAKIRWVSNGSAINARANKKPMWRELGYPVAFYVGEKGERFGEDLERLEGPGYAGGFLPIVEIAYRHEGTRYKQEVFASCNEALAAGGAALVRFTAGDSPGRVTAEVDTEGPLLWVAGVLRDKQDRVLVQGDDRWRWDDARHTLQAELATGQSAALAVYSQPLADGPPAFSEQTYEAERAVCVKRWQALLDRGARFEVPEPIVQNAWKSLVIGNFMIAVGDRMHYSAGNAYYHLYEAECGDAVRAMMQYGHLIDARRMIGPLLAFDRAATRFHVAGHKLQLLADYYWATRDADFLREKREAWHAVELIRSNRQASNGLLPADNYAGDIKQQVLSLNSNANCWRGLRDMAAVLADMGEENTAAELRQYCHNFRSAIHDAVAKSERREVQPPFIPLALLSDESPYDPLTATRLGSYYDLMAPYVIGSGVFPPGSERETWLIEYLRQHGGVAMGMIRSTPHQGEFDGEPGVNVLYGLRYMLALARRDDRGHVLAGFYGQLAQGMTRDTFIGGEGSRFFHGDRFGRSFYLPPNSASNAMFLSTLRQLLVQDWDLDDDGRPETLRLLFGAPGRWLEDGKQISVHRAPTAFGELSLQIESKLSQGEVLATLDGPSRAPKRWLLRLPLPEGWRVESAIDAPGTDLPLQNDGAIELDAKRPTHSIRFRVVQNQRGDRR